MSVYVMGPNSLAKMAHKSDSEEHHQSGDDQRKMTPGVGQRMAKGLQKIQPKSWKSRWILNSGVWGILRVIRFRMGSTVKAMSSWDLGTYTRKLS
jgi:hypothetical protein